MLKTYNEFLNDSMVNEGFFNFLKGLFKNISKLYNKVKGGNKLEEITTNYKKKLDGVFTQLSTEEQNKSAANKNTKVGIDESFIYEAEDMDKKMGYPKPKSEQTTSQPNDIKTKIKKQINQKINIIKKRINEIVVDFNKELNMLKKTFAVNNEIPRKLELAILIADGQMKDYVYGKWMGFYNTIGNQEAIKNIQKQRTIIAKEMKKNTIDLQQQVESGDVEKPEYKVGQLYKYTTSGGDETEITIKEVVGGKVTKATNKNDKEINPYTDKIGRLISKNKNFTIT